ncbi:hypothetical protein GIB67_037747 [Kingdonia uniflora]|uniref:Uncharacterized protein n=1 Tax=Kingdonia uniflora TaxID=39325 RepID=A0A7J7LV45_9MAGN|nr:hypothetical protein GIB67_037747 [Kingdonia uniflora]
MPLRNLGPPIFVTSGVWLDKLETLPTKELSDSIKVLETTTVRLLPRQEKKNHGKNLNSLKAVNGIEGADSIPRSELPEDWISGFNNF